MACKRSCVACSVYLTFHTWPGVSWSLLTVCKVILSSRVLQALYIRVCVCVCFAIPRTCPLCSVMCVSWCSQWPTGEVSTAPPSSASFSGSPSHKHPSSWWATRATSSGPVKSAQRVGRARVFKVVRTHICWWLWKCFMAQAKREVWYFSILT